MAIRLFELGFVIKAIDQMSGVVKAVEQRVEGLNAAVAGTQRYREAGRNLAVMGAAMAGAGTAIAYPLMKSVEAASDVQDQLHRLANTLPGGAEGLRDLAQAQKAAADYSMRHAQSETDLLKALYLGTSAGLSMQASLAGMRDAAALATGVNGDLETVQRTLNLAYINFRDPSKTAAQNMQFLSDVMAKAAAAFDYKDVEELRSQLELAAPTALATGTSFKEMIVALADFTRHGLTGTMAGEAFEESLHGVLTMSQKLGIQTVRNASGGLDYVRSLEQIRNHFIGLYGSMNAIPVDVLKELQKTFGIRGIRALLLDPAEMATMRAQLMDVSGATQQFQRQMETAPSKQWAILLNNLTALEVVIGNALTPSLVAIGHVLAEVVGGITRFAAAHPMLTKFVVTFVAIGAALAIVVGGAIAMVGGLLALGSFLGIGAGTLAIIGGIGAALAFAGAAVITFWRPLSGFFSALWNGIKSVFTGFANFVKNWGLTILGFAIAPWAMLPIEIYRHIGEIKKAAESVAHAIARFFVGHSPIPEGPLHRLDLSREFARTLTPAPIIGAVRRVAIATAIAAPMVAGAAAPASAAYREPGARHIAVTIHYHVHGASDPEVEAEKHGRILVRTLRRELEREARTDF